VAAQVRVPQFCIGGVNEKTLPDVLAAGARRVVIVSDLLRSANIPAYCARIRAALEQAAA
jgi:thiamine-phosphate pyrophosphorylase